MRSLIADRRSLAIIHGLCTIHPYSLTFNPPCAHCAPAPPHMHTVVPVPRRLPRSGFSSNALRSATYESCAAVGIWSGAEWRGFVFVLALLREGENVVVHFHPFSSISIAKMQYRTGIPTYIRTYIRTYHTRPFLVSCTKGSARVDGCGMGRHCVAA